MVTDLSFSNNFSKYGYFPCIAINFIIYDTTVEHPNKGAVTKLRAEK